MQSNTPATTAMDIMQEVIGALVALDEKLTPEQQKTMIANINQFLIGQVTDQQTRKACLTIQYIMDKHRLTIEYFKSPVTAPAKNRFGI